MKTLATIGDMLAALGLGMMIGGLFFRYCEAPAEHEPEVIWEAAPGVSK